MYRQGDVLLVPISEEEYRQVQAVDAWGRSRLRKVHRNSRPGYHPRNNTGLILVPGEATGHHHKVKHPKAKLEIKDGEMFLTVPSGGAALTHEEHKAVMLPAGKFRVIRQKEYEPPARTSRRTGGSTRGSSRNVYD
jgi:hypothetical protein